MEYFPIYDSPKLSERVFTLEGATHTLKGLLLLVTPQSFITLSLYVVLLQEFRTQTHIHALCHEITQFQCL